MFKNIYYINHQGDVIDLDSECYSIADVPFASHTWEYEIEETAGRERVKGKKKKLQSYTFSLRITGAGLVSHDDAYNKMLEVFETDIMANQPGKLYVDEQYLECYLQEVSANEVVDGLGSSTHSLKVIAYYPFWVEKLSKTFVAQNESDITSGLDFPFDFPFDFTSNNAGNALWEVEHYAPSHFEMIIHGPCVEPKIIINGYPYQVFAELESGDELTIDSRNNTITKRMGNDTTANLYNCRQFAPSVFEKIAGGPLVFNWTGDFRFDINLFLERSEPKW